MDIESFDEFKSSGVLLTSPRSLHACAELGVDQAQLYYVPWEAFLKKSGNREGEAKQRQAHWRKNRSRLISDVRYQRQANIMRTVASMPGMLTTPCPTLQPLKLPTNLTTLGPLRSSRSDVSAISKSISTSTRLQIADILPDKPDARQLVAQRDEARRRNVEHKINTQTASAQHRAQIMTNEKRDAARTFLKQWESHRDAAANRHDYSAENLQTQSAHDDQRREDLAERACLQKVARSEEHRALRLANMEKIREAREAKERALQQKHRERAEQMHRRDAERDHLRMMEKHARNLLREETDTEQRERLQLREIQDKERIERVLGKQKQYDVNVKRAEEEKQQLALYRRLVDAERQEKKQETKRSRVVKEKAEREGKLQKLEAEGVRERLARERRAEEEQTKNFQRELAQIDRDDAIAQAKRRRAFLKEQLAWRVQEKDNRMECRKQMSRYESTIVQQNRHRKWIARNKLQPLPALA